MKILDEEGRLFGKINIVDFLIIVLILIIIPIFFQTYRILNRMPVPVPSTKIRVEVVTFTIPEFAEYFKEGDVSYDKDGNPDGKLLKIIKKDPDSAKRIKSSMLMARKDPLSPYLIPVFLELELLCTQSEKDEPWYYRRNPIFVSLNETIPFDNPQYRISCYIINIKSP